MIFIAANDFDGLRETAADVRQRAADLVARSRCGRPRC